MNVKKILEGSGWIDKTSANDTNIIRYEKINDLGKFETLVVGPAQFVYVVPNAQGVMNYISLNKHTLKLILAQMKQIKKKKK